MPSRVTERINFGKIKEIVVPPNMIELQTNSYKEFLQADASPKKRLKDAGLESVFREVFPIKSYDEKCELNYDSYEIGAPKLDWLECLREGLTYGAPLYVTFLLKEEGKSAKEEKVFMGELPLMTPQGTFVVNGAERVVVSQLHRSPGIAFEATQHPNGKMLHSFRVIPDRGSWYEAQFDTSDLLYVYLDRKKRRRKFLTTTFFRALSFLDVEGGIGKGKDNGEKTRGGDEEILKLFYEIEEFSVKEAEKLEDLPNYVLIQDVADEEKGLVVARAFEPLSKAVVKQIAELGVTKIKVVDTSVDEGIMIKCLKKDPAKNEEEALKDIYRRLRPGDPPTAANARALLKRLFFDPKRYDLGRVGRYKINQKLGLKDKEESRILTKNDLVAATKYLLRLKKGEGSVDDIDHLGSRRIRTVGELLSNQCRVGLARTERLVKERMTLFDQSIEAMMPQKLINPKALSAVIRDFFGRSQLSQFMDQINPLAELTHKRRLSALGPGGLSRDRAGFEVRDVHPSHYGRICPIETPEGPNIGLIASLATFARINDFGFLETPYRKVENGRVTNHIDFLTADREEQFIVAQANSLIDDKGHFITDRVVCRSRTDFIDVEPARVDYMDVSPKQLVSIAASLIPFLEHDDANRALMGSNMQRQAVPLLVTEAPLVATGLEGRVALDSRAVAVAEEAGKVASVTGNQVIITEDGKLPETKKRIKHDPEKGVWVYPIRKFMRSNAATCINQKILVKKG
ncbi:MAG TPA: DNA-directed RNA polymerase subunit beta, partial [Verrucomicrobiae bacterium]